MKNIGGPYGGAITASIFLSEFVGDVPWAHLDIAGPMKVDGDEGIYAKGATGFGTRAADRPRLQLHPAGLRSWPSRTALSAASAATASATPSATR